MGVVSGSPGRRSREEGREVRALLLPAWHCSAKNQTLRLCFPRTASPPRDSPRLRTPNLLLVPHRSPQPSPQLCDTVLLNFPTRSQLVKDPDGHSQLWGGSPLGVKHFFRPQREDQRTALPPAPRPRSWGSRLARSVAELCLRSRSLRSTQHPRRLTRDPGQDTESRHLTSDAVP